MLPIGSSQSHFCVMQSGIVYAASWEDLVAWVPLFDSASPDYATLVSFDGKTIVGTGRSSRVYGGFEVHLEDGVFAGTKILSDSYSQSNLYVQPYDRVALEEVANEYSLQVIGGSGDIFFCVSQPGDALVFCNPVLRESAKWLMEDFFVSQVSNLVGSSEFFYPSIVDPSMFFDGEVEVVVPLFDCRLSIVDSRTVIVRDETFIFWGADRLYKPPLETSNEGSDSYVRVFDRRGELWRVFGERNRVFGIREADV
jgi:hypothetical protein